MYAANEPNVSFRNGQFIVTDGQHTIEGRILCKVNTGMTVEQEALQGYYIYDLSVYVFVQTLAEVI